MNNYVRITLEIKGETHSRDFGRALLSVFCNFAPSLMPDLLDSGEDGPHRTPFDDLETAMNQWGKTFSLDMRGGDPDAYWGARWKRKQEPRYNAYFMHGIFNRRNFLTPSTLSFKAKWNPKVDWAELFLRLCNACDTRAALMHHLTPRELSSAISDFAYGIIAPTLNTRFHDLRFPGITWAMMFGAEFLDRVDARAIKDAGFGVRQVGTGYLVQVTDSLLDVLKRYDHFCERRETLLAFVPASVLRDTSDDEVLAWLAAQPSSPSPDFL